LNDYRFDEVIDNIPNREDKKQAFMRHALGTGNLAMIGISYDDPFDVTYDSLSRFVEYTIGTSMGRADLKIETDGGSFGRDEELEDEGDEDRDHYAFLDLGFVEEENEEEESGE
jgi:hypothetical protein